MGKRSTRLKIAFFGLLLAGFVVIQYCWVLSLQEDKSDEFKLRLVWGINEVGHTISLKKSLNNLTVPTLTNLLQQQFSAKGLANIHFEFSVNSKNHPLASSGFHSNQLNNSSHLALHYIFQPNKENSVAEDTLIVVVPFFKNFIWKKMIWVIAASVFLTMMIMVIFYYASLLGARNQQLFYDNKTHILKNMMQQLETPLSTVSVAAEALRNASVMQDTAQINYYQRIINEESQRMNEQLKQFLQELK